MFNTDFKVDGDIGTKSNLNLSLSSLYYICKNGFPDCKASMLQLNFYTYK